MIRHYLHVIVAGVLLVGVALGLPVRPTVAQTAPDAPMQISWEVRNRFRLFR